MIISDKAQEESERLAEQSTIIKPFLLLPYETPMLTSIDGAVLIDVRFSPTSETMRWRQIYLKTLLRKKYHHLPHFGSRIFREGKAQMQNLDLGIKKLLSFNAKAVLMCECGDPRKCHRLLIVQELCSKGFEAEELKTWKLIDT